MSYCVNPKCHERQNPQNTKYCITCNTSLSLYSDRFRIIEKISTSSESHAWEVFKVIDNQEKSANIYKVLKTLKNHNSLHKELFDREKMVLRKLRHSGIPAYVVDFILPAEKDRPELDCLIMEWIEGQDLSKWVESNKLCNKETALQWLKKITSILSYIHGKKYFHRDIKPGNIILKNNEELFLIDYGIARETTDTVYEKGASTEAYTLAYAAPEQLNGAAVPQSDFYALGKTFMHLLTGISPNSKKLEFSMWEYETNFPTSGIIPLLKWMMKEDPAQRPETSLKIIEIIDYISTRKPDGTFPNDRDTANQIGVICNVLPDESVREEKTAAPIKNPDGLQEQEKTTAPIKNPHGLQEQEKTTAPIKNPHGLQEQEKTAAPIKNPDGLQEQEKTTAPIKNPNGLQEQEKTTAPIKNPHGLQEQEKTAAPIKNPHGLQEQEKTTAPIKNPDGLQEQEKTTAPIKNPNGLQEQEKTTAPIKNPDGLQEQEKTTAPIKNPDGLQEQEKTTAPIKNPDGLQEQEKTTAPIKNPDGLQEQEKTTAPIKNPDGLQEQEKTTAPIKNPDGLQEQEKTTAPIKNPDGLQEQEKTTAPIKNPDGLQEQEKTTAPIKNPDGLQEQEKTTAPIKNPDGLQEQEKTTAPIKIFGRNLKILPVLFIGLVVGALLMVRIFYPKLDEVCNSVSGDGISCGEEILLREASRNSHQNKKDGARLIADGRASEAIKPLNVDWDENHDPETLIMLENAKLVGIDTLVRSIAITIPGSQSTPQNIPTGMLKAVAFAQQRWNENSSHKWKLRLVLVDDQNSKDIAVKLTDTLLKRGVYAGIGSYSSDVTLPVKDVYQRNGTVLISGTSTARILTNPNASTFFFRVCSSNEKNTQKISDYLEKNNYRRIVLFHTAGEPFSDSMTDELTSQMGRRSIVKAFNFRGTNPAINQIKEAKKLGAQAIVLFPGAYTSGDPERDRTLSIIKANNGELPIIGNEILKDPNLFDLEKKLLQKIAIALPWHPSLLSSKEFNPPKYWGEKKQLDHRIVMNYDAIQTIIKALDQLPINKNEDVIASRQEIQKILSSSGFRMNGYTGDFSFVGSDRRETVGGLVRPLCNKDNKCEGYVAVP